MLTAAAGPVFSLGATVREQSPITKRETI